MLGSASTCAGRHVSRTATGRCRLPSRMLSGKHSRMIAGQLTFLSDKYFCIIVSFKTPYLKCFSNLIISILNTPILTALPPVLLCDTRQAYSRQASPGPHSARCSGSAGSKVAQGALAAEKRLPQEKQCSRGPVLVSRVGRGFDQKLIKLAYEI